MTKGNKRHITDEELKTAILEAKRELGTWEKVAERFGKNKGTLRAIANGMILKTPSLRMEYGLDVFAPAPVCPIHGVVHIGKCPKKKKEKMIREMTKQELVFALENRMEFEREMIE